MRAGAWKAVESVDPVILIEKQTLQQVKGGRGDGKPKKRDITGTEPERRFLDPNEPTRSPLQPVWAAMFADAAKSVAGEGSESRSRYFIEQIGPLEEH